MRTQAGGPITSCGFSGATQDALPTHTHERLIEGAPGRLREPIMHEAVTDLDQMIAKMNGYSTALAQTKFEEGRRATLAGALHGTWAFFAQPFCGPVFSTGAGFILAVANAEGSYYRYVKLMLLARGKRDS